MFMGKAWLRRVRAGLILSAVTLVGSVVTLPVVASPAPKEMAPSMCEGFEKKQKIGRMGGRNAFSRKGVKTVADLQKVAVANEADIRALFAEQGLGALADKFLAAIAEGRVGEGQLKPNDRLQWMAYRKKGKTPAILENACLATKRNYDTFVVEIPVVDEKLPVDAVCKLTAAANCQSKTFDVSAAGSSSGVTVSMTSPSGTKPVSNPWSGAIEDTCAAPDAYSWEAKANGTDGWRKTTLHTFVVPKVCINFAYQGAGEPKVETLPAKPCSTKAGPTINGQPITTRRICEPKPAMVDVTVTPTQIWRHENVSLDANGYWAEGKVVVEVLDQNQTPVDGLGQTTTFPQTLGPFDRAGKYTAKATVGNECQGTPLSIPSDSASDMMEFDVLNRWAARPYLWAWSPADEEVRTVTAATAMNPEDRTFFSLGNAQGAGIGLAYLLSQRVSLDGDLLFGKVDGEFQHDRGAAWTMGDDSGSVAGLTFGPSFHLTPGRRVDFFVGPFVGVFDLGDYEFQGVNRRLDRGFDSEVGFGAQLGLDVPFGQQSPWSAFFGGRYMKLSGEVSNTGQELDIDPLSVAAGVAYHF